MLDDQLVADVAHGHDPGIPWARQLASEPGDLNVDGAVVHDGGATARAVQEHFPGQHAARAFGQNLQQIELAAGQIA